MGFSKLDKDTSNPFLSFLFAVGGYHLNSTSVHETHAVSTPYFIFFFHAAAAAKCLCENLKAFNIACLIHSTYPVLQTWTGMSGDNLNIMSIG